MSTRNPETKPETTDDVLIDAHGYNEARAAHLTKRYGSQTDAWDPEFAQLDAGDALARKTSQELKNIIAANTVDPEKPLRFSVTVANRQIAIDIRAPQDPSGKWTTQMPCPIEGGWEWRVLSAPDYDTLIGLINKQLAAAPVIRHLTAEESLELSRLCVTKNNLAEVVERYVELRCGKSLDASMLSDPRFLGVTNDAAMFVFLHSEPTVTDSPAFREFLKTYASGRPYNVVLIKAAYEEFKKRETSMEKMRLKGLTPEGDRLPEHVGQAELQNASDKEIAQSLSGIRREFAETERRKRELLHTPCTPEEAIRRLRGPSLHGEEL
jgi:hypothetical protein